MIHFNNSLPVETTAKQVTPNLLPAAVALHEQRRQEFGNSPHRHGEFIASCLCQVRDGLPDRSDAFFIEAMEVLQMDADMAFGFLEGLHLALNSEHSFEDGAELATGMLDGNSNNLDSVVRSLRGRDEQFCSGFVHGLAHGLADADSSGGRGDE